MLTVKSFPPPLTAAEEQYYLQKYTEGDLEAKHILIEHNLRLVAHIVKKYQTLGEDTEDLLSIGKLLQSLASPAPTSPVLKKAQ